MSETTADAEAIELREALTDIRGIGPATAEAIEAVLEEHHTNSAVDDDAQHDLAADKLAAIGEAAEALETALEYFATDRPQVAQQHIEDAYATLDALE